MNDNDKRIYDNIQRELGDKLDDQIRKAFDNKRQDFADKGPPTRPAVNDHFRGKYNIYACDECGEHIVTIDVDAGVTPFTIPCGEYCTPNCKGSMISSMYRVAQNNMPPRAPMFGGKLPALLKPDYEWRRLTHDELCAKFAKCDNTAIGDARRMFILDHHDNGGLFIMPPLYGEAPDWYLHIMEGLQQLAGELQLPDEFGLKPTYKEMAADMLKVLRARKVIGP